MIVIEGPPLLGDLARVLIPNNQVTEHGFAMLIHGISICCYSSKHTENCEFRTGGVGFTFET